MTRYDRAAIADPNCWRVGSTKFMTLAVTLPKVTRL
jgi:hypothetical protein